VADTFAIAIQFGAILAIVFLYAGRLRTMAEGMVGRSEQGRRIAIGLVIAVLPAVVIGVLFEPVIKDRLLGTWQVIAAWLVWGVVTLVVSDRWGREGGTAIEQITVRQGLLIGVAQVLAMWPGTSRSLVTILAALVLGLSLAAAVEFSFLLGLVTLGGATVFEALTNGGTMVDAYGWVDPLLGLLAAFVSAMIAVKWMVGYLQKHSFAIFGWYRIGVAVVATVLVLSGAI
jgi:undecaprenyl-diphosphatase